MSETRLSNIGPIHTLLDWSERAFGRSASEPQPAWRMLGRAVLDELENQGLIN